MRKTLFISDLHLDENRPEMTEQFLRLLRDCDAGVDALYILGDLFEVWIGDDDDTVFHQVIIQALREATQRGVPIYFLHGNRDFLVGRKFKRSTGCEFVEDGTVIDLYHTPVLLMHGDTLCTRDFKYLKSRKLARNRLLQKLFLLLPLRVRRKLADKMRMASQRHTQSVPLEIMDVTLDEVEQVMREREANYLIHGHTHRMGMHQFTLNHAPAMRIVLGAWHHCGSVLIWDEAGRKELVELR
jgi:UDP-2,3-diacylglucosamine hydrolase